jgi:two-component system response regulator FixJ
VPTEAVVHIVDDDEALRRALQRLLRASGYIAPTYATAGAFLEAAPRLTGCVLLDLRMPDMDGLEAQAQLARRGIQLPVIVVTGHGDIATAVQVIKAGALDFLEKPIDEDRLLTAVRAAFQEGAHKIRDDEADHAARRLAELSPRERQVLDSIVAGRPNKLIAYDLNISVRTVEVHRARLLVRLGTHSMATAIRLGVLAALASS